VRASCGHRARIDSRLTGIDLLEPPRPPAGTFVDFDGTRLHYVGRGQGPAVVLLHGNGMTLQDVEASGVLGLAAEHHRVLAFDRPGFGYSSRPRSTLRTPAAQADVIARALVQLGVERAVVVGHSWGAMVALALTTRSSSGGWFSSGLLLRHIPARYTIRGLAGGSRYRT